MYVHPIRSEHNIGVDFLVSIQILTEILSSYNTVYFAEFSHIEEIVETDPLPLVDPIELEELTAKLNSISALEWLPLLFW